LSGKGEITRQKLLTAARKLFLYQGYANTSVGDICREAGVNRGNLYFHFPGKRELAIAVLETARERELPFMRRAMGDEPDPLKRLELMLGAVAGYTLERGCRGGCLYGNLAQETGDSEPPIAQAAAKFFIIWEEMITRLLEQARQQGRLDPSSDVQALARLVTSAMEGALLIAKAGKDPSHLKQTVDALLDLLGSRRAAA
jgi:TetR/AcrR family transcriptional regulator, transcriptional repressor for nem operon